MSRVPDTLQGMSPQAGEVKCLGLVFESDDARREHFRNVLAEKLRTPEYRSQPGFPTAEDEDILRMSDPPYYTACPNPFLEDFIRVYGKHYDPAHEYHRDPFAVDVSVGKTDALYRAHSYHTKVPHLAIVPSILHYTEPGDVVLDGFCGSGMTGVAAQFAGAASPEYRMKLEAEWAQLGLEPPRWGARRAVLGDLAPAATSIAAGYNLPFDAGLFEREARRILDEVEAEFGWVYRTSESAAAGTINYTVWSEVYTCPECGGEVVFLQEALDLDTKRVRDTFPCPTCNASLTKKLLEQRKSTERDECTGGSFATVVRVPVAVNYRTHQGDFDKPMDEHDRDVLARVGSMSWPAGFPCDRMMHSPEDTERWGDKWRAGTAAFRNVHHLYLKRSALVLWAIWSKAAQVVDARCRSQLLFTFDQTLWTASVLNRYRPASSFGNGPLKGVYYVPGQIAEANVLSLAKGALERVLRGFREHRRIGEDLTFVTTGDCSNIGLPDQSVDYIFTDPPFGANFAYAELNFITEAFYRVFTNVAPEAIVSPARSKSVHEYQDLMSACFAEYYRVLKPGRWMTVVFSNSSNAIWRSIQEALASAGFVVGDVRTLDKKHGSFNQVIGVTVDQDLIVTVYRPSSDLEQALSIETTAGDSAWTFVNEHLSHVPVVSSPGGSIEVLSERTSQMLHDRMVGFFVQRGLAVPLSAAEFMAGLAQRYPERDGMYFLSQQVAAYDKRRAQSESVRQLSLIVTDESSAIQWIRQQLGSRPQTFPELAPVFMREAQQSWAKHEEQVELKALLDENFLLYDGKGPVPSQIKSYLSTNWREYRNLGADDPSLQAKAKDRWYVPDPSKAADLEKLRERQLLKEFAEYATSSARKIKVFRTEAVRAGFKRAYDERDWDTIVAVAERLPDSVVQEDEKLLMYYDVARMRVG